MDALAGRSVRASAGGLGPPGPRREGAPQESLAFGVPLPASPGGLLESFVVVDEEHAEGGACGQDEADFGADDDPVRFPDGVDLAVEAESGDSDDCDDNQNDRQTETSCQGELLRQPDADFPDEAAWDVEDYSMDLVMFMSACKKDSLSKSPTMSSTICDTE